MKKKNKNKSALPFLTEAQLEIIWCLINAGRNSILEEHIPIKAEPRTFWVYAVKGSGKVSPYTIQLTTNIKELIYKGILVPIMSDKEFSIQYALGVLNVRQYRLTNRLKWIKKLKVMSKSDG